MNENERRMEPEINPYDHLIEPETEPVRSPVILANANEPDRNVKSDAAMEIIPLAEKASYSKIPVKECRTEDVISVEVEDELLVPDTFPDMETILNMDAVIDSVNIHNENEASEIKGKIGLETIYRSDENYGNNISVLSAELNFKETVKCEGIIYLNTQIRKIDYRIINERKYKVRVFLTIDVKRERESEYKVFEGIESENLYFHKEQISLIDLVSRKISESDVREDLFLNDEKIRPVKILKYKVTIAENHRQLTKEKLILNQTLWVRVMYLAEIASKGNLSNQVMYFQEKVDHTQFIPLGKSEGEVVSCEVTSSAEKIKVEINRESSGFEISGEVVTEAVCYGLVEKEMVTDFYHDKEEMTCDIKTEKVCTGVNCISVEQTVRESIDLQQESGEELRIIYQDAWPVDTSVTIEGNSIIVRGKLHIEVVVMNEGDYTILMKKICDFTCVKEQVAGEISCMELNRIFVREMKSDISGRKVTLTAQLQGDMNIYNEVDFIHISNPCIMRSGKPAKSYPITIHTVIDGETVWDIGKKYKVSADRVTHYNKEENIRPGNKIIIVK